MVGEYVSKEWLEFYNILEIATSQRVNNPYTPQQDEVAKIKKKEKKKT